MRCSTYHDLSIRCSTSAARKLPKKIFLASLPKSITPTNACTANTYNTCKIKFTLNNWTKVLFKNSYTCMFLKKNIAINARTVNLVLKVTLLHKRFKKFEFLVDRPCCCLRLHKIIKDTLEATKNVLYHALKLSSTVYHVHWPS